jgi:hypothetical protein
MARRSRRATEVDIADIAESMPYVSAYEDGGKRAYQVGGKSFIFFRNPRPDAFDPATGERYDDVVVFWVGSQEDKEAMVQEPRSPWFTTPHFKGHPSVLLRTSRIGEVTRDELEEVIQDAWLSRASPTRAKAWLKDHGLA